MRADQARELRRTLVDARALAAALGLQVATRASPSQAVVLCPWHQERSPSCSVRLAKDGTLAVKCQACGASGDALTLIAQVRGLDARNEFHAVLREAARLARYSDMVDASSRPASRSASPAAWQERHPTSRTYPPLDQVNHLWSACDRCDDDQEAQALLAGRGLDAQLVDLFGLARVIPHDLPLPRWARFRGATWTDTGHRLLVPVFDASGVMRSVRAWCVRGTADVPKRLPPAGHRAAGLVLAEGIAVAMLAGQQAPTRVVIVEGEPDFLTWATRFSDADAAAPAVLGVVSGAWSDEVAARIPNGAPIVVRTDHDEAGEKYARAVNGALARRCHVFRARPEVP